MKNTLRTFMILTIIVTASCNRDENIQLKNGDILFREAFDTKLSKVIDQVTQTDSATHFSHVGILQFIENAPSVLHASPNGGTCKVTLEAFRHPNEDSTRVVVYRLKDEYQFTIPDAIAKANSMLGKPYNFSYILNDSTHYCSEFVFNAFSKDSIFEMNPMTFIDPESGNFAEGWIDYYKNLGLEIPEGLMGCNPNGMAASEKLICIGDLH
ncbi:YiiX/YebB-like N1pC/P60 family cysteine hydrolase [Sunxiuqinia sp. A32]|uniref:YiiX/YebB-like N1pC/P60 family cysteine hydrolase n=1 Tax=Sunxiuqinia sp. A32 TaxID=3461496 RepID=UPI004045AD48